MSAFTDPDGNAARNARNRQRDRALRAALTANPVPPLEAMMLVALWALSIVAAVVIVGTDPETWRAADRMIDDAQGADS